MFENIEKVIKSCGKIHIEAERYGSGFLAGFDFLSTNNSTFDKEATITYEGTEVFDAIDEATCPGDMDAMHTLDKLTEYSKLHPEFLFVLSYTLEEVLDNLEKRAELWNALSSNEQDDILLGFVAFEPAY